jgi:hypothetical protein
VTPPVIVPLVWTAAVAVLVVLGATLGPRHLALAMAACATITIVVATLFEASQINQYGILFQGRYIQPMILGVVLIAGRALDELDATLLRRVLPLARTVLILVVVGHVVSLWSAARRFAVGVRGPVLFVRHEAWDPGVPLIVPLVAGALAVTVIAWLLWRQCLTVDREVPGAPPPDAADDPSGERVEARSRRHVAAATG